MSSTSKALSLVLAITALLLLPLSPATAQPIVSARSRVLQAVDDTRSTRLSGNTHPLARAEFDQGELSDTIPMRRITMLLQRSPEQEIALQQLIDQQQDKTSSTYHQWLTPENFGAAFGPSDRDLSIVTAWLSAHGFNGIQVNAARTRVEFNGTAGTVREAFRTSMHRYKVGGEDRYANASDPSIPAALSPVVSGIASLNSFPRKAENHRVAVPHDQTSEAATSQTTNQATNQARPTAQPSSTINNKFGVFYGVTPYDFATIYNVLPLWSASTPIDGTGQAIAVVGQTDINPADFVNFRKLFSLPLGNTATPTGTQYLNIIYNGPNPGVNGDEGEGDIDTQWASAVAKGATIDYVVSQSTEVMQGTDLSAIYIVDNNLAPVLSYSYGQCELFLGTSGNNFYRSLWQQAAAQGITAMLPSGDAGAAGCDLAGSQGASNGAAVNGLASTPYNVAVGGTDFYMPSGGTAFWNSSNNGVTQASVKGYIPEIPWNQSCTNSFFSTVPAFLNQTSEQVCNNSTAIADNLLSIVGAGGGRSSCIQSNGTLGSCKGGYPKPAWQASIGVPADGVRDLPDVSLFASSGGLFGAFYIVCQQSVNADGQPCSLSAPSYDFAGFGGTSVSTPAFAGMMAMVNQKTGSRQGNANYVLYGLANQQARSGASCSSISGAPGAGCVFNDITTSTIAMPCVSGTPNCTVNNASDHYGVLSGQASTVGYDLATGLGSVNAANLVNNWSGANFVASSTILSRSPTTIVHGSPVSASVKVAAVSGIPTGDVSINALAPNGSVQSGTLQNGAYTTSLGNFPGGAYSVQAHYAGDGSYAASDSNPITLTVTPESSTTALQSLLYTPATGSTSTVSNGGSYPYGGMFLIRATVAGLSGKGVATGNVTLTDSGSPLDGGLFRLNSTSNTEDQTRTLAPGTHVITAAYAGDASFNASTSAPLTINITKATTSGTVQTNLPVLSAAGVLVLTAQISARGYGSSQQQGYGMNPPSGMVTFISNGRAVGSAALTPKGFPSVSSDVSSISFTLPASQLTVGSNSVTINYGGDANYAPSTSAPISVTVTSSTQAATTTIVTLSTASVAQGGSFTFTGNVSPHSPQPSGTVTFASDGQLISQPVPLFNGVGSVSASSVSIPAGVHQITAIYSGDSNYQASVSAPASFTVNAATLPSVTTIGMASSSVVQGATVAITTSITPAAPVPTGTVRRMVDGTLYGSPVVLTGATMSIPLPTDTLQSGAHVVRIVYSGDGNYAASTSAPLTLTLMGSVGSFTVTPNSTSATAVLGKTSNPVTFTATPVAGFHSTITFACTGGLPSGATCVFAPSSITPDGTNPQTTALTISPATTTSSNSTAPLQRSSQVGAALAGLLLLLLPRRTRRWNLLALLLAVCALGGLSGCGSGVTVANGTSSATLAKGSYTVTVTAIGGPTIQTATVNFTIQ
jgi:hypothetical protein